MKHMLLYSPPVCSLHSHHFEQVWTRAVVFLTECSAITDNVLDGSGFQSQNGVGFFHAVTEKYSSTIHLCVMKNAVYKSKQFLFK